MREEYEIEPELRGPTPRALFRRKGSAVGAGCMRIFVAPFVLAGVAVLLLCLVGTLVSVAGRDLPGQIVSRQDTPSSDGDAYRVRYTYHQGDSVYAGSDSVSDADYLRLPPGAPVTVHALPFAPTLMPYLRPAARSRIRMLVIFWVFTLFWNTLVSVFAWVAYLWPMIERLILATGKPAQARVTNKTQTAAEDGTACALHYEFLPAEMEWRGGVVKGKINVPQAQWDAIDVGDALTVLYIPGKPKWSVLYRFARYAAVAPPA